MEWRIGLISFEIRNLFNFSLDVTVFSSAKDGSQRLLSNIRYFIFLFFFQLLPFILLFLNHKNQMKEKRIRRKNEIKEKNTVREKAEGGERDY